MYAVRNKRISLSQSRMSTSESMKSASESICASASSSREGSAMREGLEAAREPGARGCRRTRRRGPLTPRRSNSQSNSASISPSSGAAFVASAASRTTRRCSRTSDAAHQRSSHQSARSPGKRCTATLNSRSAYRSQHRYGSTALCRETAKSRESKRKQKRKRKREGKRSTHELSVAETEQRSSERLARGPPARRRAHRVLRAAHRLSAPVELEVQLRAHLPQGSR